MGNKKIMPTLIFRAWKTEKHFDNVRCSTCETHIWIFFFIVQIFHTVLLLETFSIKSDLAYFRFINFYEIFPSATRKTRRKIHWKLILWREFVKVSIRDSMMTKQRGKFKDWEMTRWKTKSFDFLVKKLIQFVTQSVGISARRPFDDIFHHKINSTPAVFAATS